MPSLPRSPGPLSPCGRGLPRPGSATATRAVAVCRMASAWPHQRGARPQVSRSTAWPTFSSPRGDESSFFLFLVPMTDHEPSSSSGPESPVVQPSSVRRAAAQSCSGPMFSRVAGRVSAGRGGHDLADPSCDSAPPVPIRAVPPLPSLNCASGVLTVTRRGSRSPYTFHVKRPAPSPARTREVRSPAASGAAASTRGSSASPRPSSDLIGPQSTASSAAERPAATLRRRVFVAYGGFAPRTAGRCSVAARRPASSLSGLHRQSAPGCRPGSSPQDPRTRRTPSGFNLAPARDSARGAGRSMALPAVCRSPGRG